MDVKGARELMERLAERQWRLAPGWSAGTSPATTRTPSTYAFPANGDGGEARRVKKILVDGHWRPTTPST